ncbi:autotransporter domain-containing protein [Thermomonas sp. HDW16]|nr:autotransporter domain-containing protein [Thermomonas sp. HDW16]
MSPASGPAAGGTTVTITGTRLTGATAVNFGTTVASSFTVDTDTQITATAPAGSGTVDVIVTTPGGTSAASQYTYIPPPAVTSVAVPAAGRYLSGETLDFTVTFNEAVTVTGTPQLAVVIGTTTVQAAYLSGSGSNALVFRYTVVAGDSDNDGIALGALSANGGSVQDAVGNDADLTLNNVAGTTGVLVGQQSQTITFDVQANQAFAPNGTFALNPVATASSGLAISYTSQTTGVCTISNTTVTMLSAGTCTIAADQAGDANYTAATPVSQTIAISQATQTITGFAANPAAPTYAPNGTFSVSATGGASGNPVTFASTSPSICTVSGSTVTMLSAGTCSLTADQAGDANYTAATQEMLNAVIGQATQTITFGAQTNQTYAPNGTFALNPLATASSGLAVSYSSLTGTVCSISGSTVTMLSAGTCTIAADQAGDANYTAATQVTQTITISQATQAIAGFAATPATPTYAPGGTFSVAATGGASGNPVVFATTTSGVCSVAGSTVTMLSAGTCTITADQAGNTSYSAAPQATLTVMIGKAAPVLGWTTDISKVYGEAAFDLPAPASTSPGTFTFASSNAQVATVSGTTVTLVGAGSTTLTATQAATTNYQAASISITLTVSDRPDPTKDPSVAGGLQAQVDASVRFAQVQQDNIRGRLQQLRSGGNASSNTVALRVGGSLGQLGLTLNAGQAGMTPTMPQGWGFWSAGSVVVGERDARSTREGFDFHSDGVTFGVDRLIGDNAVLGAAGGFGWNDSDLDDGRSSLDARQRSLALYGLWRADAWFVDGILGWGRLDFDIVRWSAVANATATAKRDGDQLFGSLTLGYEHRAGNGAYTGYGRLDSSRTTLDAYREAGLGIYDLQYAKQDVDSSTAALGVEGRYAFSTDTAMIRPYWMLEWRQSLQNNADAGINYVVLPRSGDYLLGLRSYNDDVASFGAGIDMAFGNGWNLAFEYRREQARDLFANTFGIRLSYGQLPRLSPSQTMLQPGDQTGMLTAGSARPQP